MFLRTAARTAVGAAAREQGPDGFWFPRRQQVSLCQWRLEALLNRRYVPAATIVGALPDARPVGEHTVPLSDD